MGEIKFRLIGDGKIVGYEEHRYIENALNKKFSGVGIYHSRTGHEMSWKNVSMNDNEKCYIQHDKKDGYTGLKDKHGKEIYGGDILKRLVAWSGTPAIYVVEYGLCTFDSEVYTYIGFGFKVISGEPRVRNGEYAEETFMPHHIPECEIIGNIYENPELLEVK